MGGSGLAAHQLVSVRGHHGDAFGSDVEINAVHHGAQLVIGRSKDGAVDSVHQYLCVHVHADGIFAQCSGGGELVGVLPHEVIFSVLVLYGQLQGVEVNVECQGLLGDFLECVQQSTGGDGEASVGIAFHHFQRGHHGGLAVGHGDGQDAVLQFKEETIQNGQRILGVDDAADALQMGGESRTRNDEIHSYIFVFSLLLCF